MAVTDSHQPLIVGKDAELGGSINEKAIVRKLNKHILLKFFLMCILCYIGECPFVGVVLEPPHHLASVFHHRCC